MGLSPFSSDNDTFPGGITGALHERVVERVVEVPLPNPVPENFVIQRLHGIGSYVCALVNYPDATNFEGDKIIVFENTSPTELEEAKAIDPHFAEDGTIIARFKPDEQGWLDALWFAEHRDTRG